MSDRTFVTLFTVALAVPASLALCYLFRNPEPVAPIPEPAVREVSWVCVTKSCDVMAPRGRE